MISLSHIRVFAGLKRLRISRRPVTDAALTAVLSRNPELESLELAACNAVTDASLCKCPSSLRELSLVMCEAVEGVPLVRLKRLETLRITKCPKVRMRSVQVRHLQVFVAA
jgi:hypothetical protein